MFFGKSEKKRWHPCLVIAIGALAAIGTLTVVERGKCLVMGMKDKMISMVKKDNSCSSGCD